MAKVKVRLTHVCNAKEHPGQPGDEITVEADLAAAWQKKRGCKILGEAKPATPAAAGKTGDK